MKGRAGLYGKALDTIQGKLFRYKDIGLSGSVILPSRALITISQQSAVGGWLPARQALLEAGICQKDTVFVIIKRNEENRPPLIPAH